MLCNIISFLNSLNVPKKLKKKSSYSFCCIHLKLITNELGHLFVYEYKHFTVMLLREENSINTLL